VAYYKVLDFKKEPFSTSPDPEFFYLSRDHETALTNALIELRLKRGLSVILGDVGTGKTTLSRKLIQELKERPDFLFHIILDPYFEDQKTFMQHLVRSFDIPIDYKNAAMLELRDAFEEYLFQKGVIEGKTVVLIIDESQKIDQQTLEALRILLNYETNQFKLLQLVLLGQMEFHSKIIDMPNFQDRVSFKYALNPLNFKETKEMINFRIQKAGYSANMHLFLDGAIKEIYHYTKGYPRQITTFCHRAIKALVLRKKFVVDQQLVGELIQDDINLGWHKSKLVQKNSY